MANEIRIDDLRTPVLNDMQRMGLDYGETVHTELSVDAVFVNRDYEPAAVARDAAIGAALQQAGVKASKCKATAELSGGSVGTALRLIQADGASRYAELINLATTAPGLDRTAALSIADKCSGIANAEIYDVTINLVEFLLNRLARFGAMQPAHWIEAAPDEHATLTKLAPDIHAARKWAQLAHDLNARVDHARAVNLDPSGVILDMLLNLDDVARP